MKRGTWLLASLALVLVAGCGGDDDSLPETPVLTPTSEAPGDLSREDLISQADSVCAEVNAAIGAVEASTSDAASQLGQKADLYEGMVEQIRDLGGDRDPELSEMLTAGDELVQAERDAQLAAERGDDTALLAAEDDAAEALASFQSEASDYGFEECGEGPSAPSTAPTDPSDVTPVAPTPVAPTPVAPTPAPVAPAPPSTPSGGAGIGGGGAGTGAPSDDGGGNAGSGGIGPG
jgi:hypothetical protein